MKQALALVVMYVSLASCALAAPVVLPSAGVEASVNDSIRSFESAYSQLDDKVQTAARDEKAFSRREKLITGIAAGLTTLGTGGYIISSAVPMATRRRKQARIAELEAAVARADAAAKRRSSNVVRMGRVLGKREEMDGLREAAEAVVGHGDQDAESFYSAISRTPSMRIGDFVDHMQHTPVYASRLRRSQSVPSSRTSASVSLNEPATPSRPIQERLVQDNIDTHERIAQLETAVLDLRKHQHDWLSERLSAWTKGMIAAGLINAAGGIVSAELSVQNTIEGSGNNSTLPDVSHLDAKTCKQFAKKIDGLNCSKAHGITAV